MKTEFVFDNCIERDTSLCTHCYLTASQQASFLYWLPAWRARAP